MLHVHSREAGEPQIPCCNSVTVRSYILHCHNHMRIANPARKENPCVVDAGAVTCTGVENPGTCKQGSLCVPPMYCYNTHVVGICR